MKKCRLQTVNANGKVIGRSSLQIKENSILIQQLPEGMSAKMAHDCHRNLFEALNNYEGGGVLTIPSGIQLGVLEV